MREEISKPGPMSVPRCPCCGVAQDRRTVDGRGYYHAEDCIYVRGGAELRRRQAEEDRAYEREPMIPRNKAAAILRAILMTVGAKNRQEHLELKAAVLEELSGLSGGMEIGNKGDML